MECSTSVLLPSSCVDQHMPASALLRRWQQRRNLITKLGVLALLCILLAEAACAFLLLELGHVSVAVHTHNPGFLERAKRVDMRQFDETLPKWRERSSTAPFIGMTLRTSQGQDARGAHLEAAGCQACRKCARTTMSAMTGRPISRCSAASFQCWANFVVSLTSSGQSPRPLLT